MITQTLSGVRAGGLWLFSRFKVKTEGGQKMESQFTKNKILSELAKSPHGNLQEYMPVGQQAAQLEPEFMAHLISWNMVKGDVRDSKVALPVVSLTVPQFTAVPEFIENSLAHFAALGPRELVRAYRFALAVRPKGFVNRLGNIIETYLRNLEADRGRWDRTALQHRRPLRSLYTLAHVKAGSDYVSRVLHHGKNRDKNEASRPGLPAGSIFEVVAGLKQMSSADAASAIITSRIPFLIAMGALEEKAKDTDLLHALITQMSPSELVTNTKLLERCGVKTNPALRGAFEEGLKRASKSTANMLKTTRAAEVVEDEGLKEKLVSLQERQIEKLGGIDGDWLVLGDSSPSMSQCIEVARTMAATLAKFVKGKVSLIFFDSSPRYFDVTGKDYGQILADTRHVLIGGGTSIGCGVQYAMDKKLPVDGIAVVSDGQENTPPFFVDRYQSLCKMLDKEPPVYFYRFQGSVRALHDRDLALTMRNAGIEMQEFDMRSQTADMYSLPNIVQTMRVSRYSLIDEVLGSRLLTLDDVLKNLRKEVPVNAA
jgi:hypothetical protein